MSMSRRQLLVSSGCILSYTLLSAPAEASIGAFFQQMLSTLAKKFPPVEFAQYVYHHIWGQAPSAGPSLRSLYANLVAQGYGPQKYAQTAGPAHSTLIASKAFHVSRSPYNTPQNQQALVHPGSATFMSVAANGAAHVTNIKDLNYSALDKAGQIYTIQRGCDCAASHMLPTAAAEQNLNVAWNNGFMGSNVTYNSEYGSVNVRQEPYSSVTLLPDGSRQYDVAHMVTVSDDKGTPVWETDRRKEALNYQMVFPG